METITQNVTAVGIAKAMLESPDVGMRMVAVGDILRSEGSRALPEGIVAWGKQVNIAEAVEACVAVAHQMVTATDTEIEAATGPRDQAESMAVTMLWLRSIGRRATFPPELAMAMYDTDECLRPLGRQWVMDSLGLRAELLGRMSWVDQLFTCLRV